MKRIMILATLTMMVFLKISGRESTTTSGQPLTTTEVFQLQIENQSLQSEKEMILQEINWCREDVSRISTEVDNRLTQWLTFISISIALIGIVIASLVSWNTKWYEKYLDSKYESLDSKIRQMNK